ncbi:Cytochrome c-type biogenesis protein CcmE, heme chaperone [Fulvivirga imtechensis AK7]|uniref:Cytochrome c-type biogenesis protein CcmE, heme chaperone n=1 Tax=Fulvivirga imtechensis AK7 TaxID=1237149 RepID=L8JRF5_9BACT|nr:cytochrome c maturation protein CcmE [Fulvivirga imtechensis]ELR71450.1 Cytochrome c-type biogenesis protein CcmE, heme chaperone [Fulvivirga imtechensis AK7]
MKTSHIIGIIIIAVAIGIIISTAGDASSYVTFDQAYAMASNGNGNSIHVVGELKKDHQGQVVGISPTADKLSFTFLMVDENNKEQQVFYNEPMPPDFQRSEKVVVIGSYHDDLFVADKILMKCPSKYQENTVSAEM